MLTAGASPFFEMINLKKNHLIFLLPGAEGDGADYLKAYSLF